MDILYTLSTWLIPLTLAIVFHEVAHGWAARSFGDMTAAKAGRLTLNPLPHVDPVGTIGLPMLLAIAGAPIFGWARPVPVEPSRMRNPRWHMVLTALAGPGSNIVLALLTIVAMAALMPLATPDAGPAATFLWANLTNFLIINVMLAIFNMLPLPPFDGSHVVEGVLPRPLAAAYARLRPFGLAAMLILFLAVPLLFPQARILDRLILPPVRWTLEQGSTLLAWLS